MKHQVQEMELKWDEAENKHTKLMAELEEKKTQKYMDLMEADSKVQKIFVNNDLRAEISRS